MDTENKKMISIQNSDGSQQDVELIAYLESEDKSKKYLVYSQGEKVNANGDEIIYISRIISEENTLKLEEITDDVEWLDVQKLLKKIANA